MAPANLKRIKATLLTSGMQRQNPALYQSINDILDFAQGSLDDLNKRIIALEPSSSGGGGGGGAPSNGSYLTILDEHVTLPNSRELLAGAGIVFNDTVAHQRTISTANGGDYVVASDGGAPTASSINDGYGSFIYITYTP